MCILKTQLWDSDVNPNTRRAFPTLSNGALLKVCRNCSNHPMASTKLLCSRTENLLMRTSGLAPTPGQLAIQRTTVVCKRPLVAAQQTKERIQEETSASYTYHRKLECRNCQRMLCSQTKAESFVNLLMLVEIQYKDHRIKMANCLGTPTPTYKANI